MGACVGPMAVVAAPPPEALKDLGLEEEETMAVAVLDESIQGIRVVSPNTKELAQKALAGDAVAQFQLGMVFVERSEGKGADWEKGLVLLRCAAAQKHVEAMCNSGAFLLSSEDADKKRERVEWFVKAAAAGDGFAMNTVACVSFVGLCTGQHTSKANGR